MWLPDSWTVVWRKIDVINISLNDLTVNLPVRSEAPLELNSEMVQLCYYREASIRQIHQWIHCRSILYRFRMLLAAWKVELFSSRQVDSSRSMRRRDESWFLWHRRDRHQVLNEIASLKTILMSNRSFYSLRWGDFSNKALRRDFASFEILRGNLTSSTIINVKRISWSLL